MLTVLQIVFTVLSAVCVAAVIPVGAFLGFTYAVFCGLGAAIFFAVMILCKGARENNAPTDSQEENTDANEQEN